MKRALSGLGRSLLVALIAFGLSVAISSGSAIAEEDGFLRATIDPACHQSEAGRIFTVENINPHGPLWGVSVEAADATPAFVIPELSGEYQADETRQIFLSVSTYDQDDWWIFAEGAFHFSFSGPAGDCETPYGLEIVQSCEANTLSWEGSLGRAIAIQQTDGDFFTESFMDPGGSAVFPFGDYDFAVINIEGDAFVEDELSDLDGSYPEPADCQDTDSFEDDDGNTFESDIEWLAAEGITRGCNPPTNDQFCPDDFVTRGQMAAFLVRALGYADDGGGDLFVDDDGDTFEGDIDKLAAAGVTRGCNPPANDRFCPDDFVTRGQMAAFLVRALGYSDDGGGDLFVDDDGGTFESDIDRLGTAGVTRGCNPPVNDRFCPDDFVTRGQMAAFLHRAFD